jgi:arylsulfatase A-like enzyme
VPVDPRLKDPAAKVEDELGQIPAYAYLPGKEHLRDYVAEYDGDVRFMDDQLGALMDWMRAQGDLDRSLVVFTADHGEALGEHGYYFEHGKLPYDDCVRVPLILVHPDWKPARIAAPVGLIDLAPTILELVGLSPGWQSQGRSILGWLQAGAPDIDARLVFSESGYVKEFEVSVRKGRFKLIKIGTKYLSKLLTGAPYELYDVLADPGETKNLVDEQPDVFAELREELDAYVEAAYQRVPPPTEEGEFTPSPEELKAMTELGYAHDKEHAEHSEGGAPKPDGGR